MEHDLPLPLCERGTKGEGVCGRPHPKPSPAAREKELYRQERLCPQRKHHMNKNFFNQLVTSSPILVVGAGRSGIAATKLLLKHKNRVILFDDSDETKLRFLGTSGLVPSDSLTFAFNTGPNFTGEFRAVIVSPGVSPHHFLITRAKEQHLPVLSEIDLASLFMAPCRMIGITGTNGKSTTTVIMESILTCAGFKALACGNLGRPLCDVVIEDNLHLDYLVLELSSFQLENSHKLKLDGAIIVNITPDHLDRHASFDHYRDAKFKIISLLKHDGHLVAHGALKDQVAHDKRASFFASFDGQDWPTLLASSKIRGSHNHENAMATSMLAQRLGIHKNAILEGLLSFKPLPHRCEVVGEKNGVIFINDSKGTTVEAVKKALAAFDLPTHLLLGGIQKGEDFSILNTKDFPHIRRYYVFGRDQKKILSDLKSSVSKAHNDLAHAFAAAFKNAQPGDAILLSPGCASYDQFEDYQHRGDVFRNLVHSKMD